ncbi:hypothetical protein DENSPDRAFT_866787 [Dentipellis sp. KUC8613]|nr:hypothetical protein DENSPDRAFT_866787 [Dentipellis sp. KUC8613]
MPRGNGGFNDSRGRGGRGRGAQRGGRGGGSKPGRGRGRGRGLGYIPYDDSDFSLDAQPNQYNNSRGFASPRGRGGRGRGTPSNRSNYNSGASTPARGGAPLRGRGGGPSSENLGPKDRERQKMLAKKLRTSTAPLSQLLYEDRPLLRPVIFVRSQTTPTLFMEEEEIFKPVAEEAGTEDKSHVPTADRVFEVFHHTDGGNRPEEDPSTSQLPSDIEGLEEIDFADMGRVREEVDAFAASTEYIAAIQEKQKGDAAVTVVEEKFTGFYIDKKPAAVVESAVAKEEIVVDRVGEDALLGEQQPMDQDDEVIVYVAPHPRNGRATPAPAPPSSAPEASTSYTPLPDIDMSPRSPSPSAVPAPTFADVQFTTLGSTPPRAVRRQYAVQPRSLRKRMHQGRIERQREQRRAMFGSFGAIMSEAHLRDEAPERDPRYDERRRGDSDVDWGDESEEGGPGEDEGGMVEDEELGLEAMKAFVKGMGPAGSRHVTMDDLEVEERVRIEDEEDEEAIGGGESEGSDSSEDEDGEAEEIFLQEEKVLVAEAGGSTEEDEIDGEEDEEDEVSSDEDQSPKSSFEARLKRIRQRTAGKTTQQMLDEQLAEEDEEGDFRLAQKWEDDEDDELVAKVQAILDDNSDILHGRDRKARKKIFKAIHNGDFDDDEFDFAAMEPARRKKDAYIPPDLRDQWARDRAKKADRKRAREQERLENAADPLAPKKGGKKGRKAMMAAAALDTDAPLANRVVDITSVEVQIRRFLENIGGPGSMSLPPMQKDARKKVHELAAAFNLKSVSKGKGMERYTTLVRTTRSGVGVNEAKVAQILRRMGRSVVASSGGRKGPPRGQLKPREGEEVGKAAPKIGQSNVGFQMLAAMGWSEGARIGITGGLDVPLTAVVKTTKLGLGASGM